MAHHRHGRAQDHKTSRVFAVGEGTSIADEGCWAGPEVVPGRDGPAQVSPSWCAGGVQDIP